MNNRPAAVPLVTVDPFFSIWSSSDCLYETNPVHWCGESQKIKGALLIDGKRYAFLGEAMRYPVITQKAIDVTATATEYTFENEKVSLKCRFTSPLLLDDMALVSRPCTYIDFEVEKKDANRIKTITKKIRYNFYICNS